MSGFGRREFLLGGAALAVAGSASLLAAQSPAPINLRVTTRTLEVNGKAATVLHAAQDNGYSGLDFMLGDQFRVRVHNDLREATLLHWHGLTPPSDQDGFPYLSQPPIPAGRSHDYDFLNNRAGTYWLYSHVGFQEQQLLAAPLIVRDKEDLTWDEQEVVILLHDFTFKDPTEILKGLQSGHKEMKMEMGPGPRRHYNDVEFDAFLANDRTLDDPEVVRVESGGHIRLRIINGGAATNFVMDFGGLDGELIEVDGRPVKPLMVKQMDLAMAQRVDVILRLPHGEGAYPILALREDAPDQTGVILATPNAQIKKIDTQRAVKTRPLNLKMERQLRSRVALSPHRADRRFQLDLTGMHEGYVWGFDGKSFDPSDPLVIRQGERVEITLTNKTIMPHPIHLHGHSFQVVAINGQPINGAVRDTVLVPAMEEVTLAFDADNPGHWAFHCHLLYHFNAGMATSILYEGYERS